MSGGTANRLKRILHQLEEKAISIEPLSHTASVLPKYENEFVDINEMIKLTKN